MHVAQDPSPGRISIHALLAESDHLVAVVKLGNVYFYPRSPCGERRVVLLFVGKPADISIHALLAESDGLRRRDLRSYLGYFYPRSPCGERHNAQPAAARAVIISIHALLAESDRGRDRAPDAAKCISIHALLAESDRTICPGCASSRYFYPRSPCGERRVAVFVRCAAAGFLSTLSLRRATSKARATSCTIPISIHALLAESDESK